VTVILFPHHAKCFSERCDWKHSTVFPSLRGYMPSAQERRTGGYHNWIISDDSVLMCSRTSSMMSTICPRAILDQWWTPLCLLPGAKHLQRYNQAPGPWFPLHYLPRSARAALHMQMFAAFTSRQTWHVGRHGHAASGVCILCGHFLEFQSQHLLDVN